MCAPDFVSEVERLSSEARDATGDRDLFAVVKRLCVLKLQARQNHPVRSIERLSQHLGEVFTTNRLGPDDVGGVVDMVQHINVTVGDAKAVNAAKVGEWHRIFLRAYSHG